MPVSFSGLPSDKHTPPQYRNRSYRQDGAIHAPAKKGDNSVRLMVKRIASKLAQQDLSEDGKRAFSLWINHLVREDSVWATKVTPKVHKIMVDRLDRVFAENFPASAADKALIVAALDAEFLRPKK